MAKRMGFVRVDSASVQGEGSYVLVRRLGYAQRQAANRMMADACGGKLPRNMDGADITLSSDFLTSNDVYTRDLLKSNVAKWNWVDDADAPLPLPAKDASVIDGLTDEEVTFLVRAIQGGAPPDAEKN